jgi:oxygen-independent coproporphyrinogen-3 oxidase
MIDTTLIRKYNVAGPRYTSYPTVPYWNANPPTQQGWKDALRRSFRLSNTEQGISLYIHLPFCESLCTYCGCNTRITCNHAVESPYLEAVLKEWNLYLALLDEKPRISEIHLGGGTPTFFSPENLERLLRGIMDTAILSDTFEGSFEAHPNNTLREHLQALAGLGFRRLSLGIQDFDSKVQKAVNRVQSVQQVHRVMQDARDFGFTSINFDLIYGLPKQTLFSIDDTIQHVIALKPDRIAFYSYAHVPWIKKYQRGFTEKDLPSGTLKRELYEYGKLLLTDAGYLEIGMDHFALATDRLYLASEQGTLHRNFMGYSHSATRLMIGLGVSSISDSWDVFVQNEKKIEDYYERVGRGELPFFKGHTLTREDLVIRRHILNLMCRLETSWHEEDEQCAEVYHARRALKEMQSDELISITPYRLQVHEKGRAFVRNVCMAFDARLRKDQPRLQLFSSVI